MLDAVYSPRWLTADSSLLAGQQLGFADVNDNEITSSGRCLIELLLSRFSAQTVQETPSKALEHFQLVP